MVKVMAKRKSNDINEFEIQNQDNIITGQFEDVIGERFGAYSKYIIQERALPDVRDGLKPVQRRILFGMKEMGMFPNSPTKKSARIVGDVMGKYHPHGDSSIYEALVRMSQWWKMREILIDMQGNNGSIDEDPAAAMRYTEARLSPIAMEMLRDIDKDTVEFALNFDDTLEEPTVLPAKFPALLVNGSKGIAAGFATDIPPHNLSEVIDGTIYRIKSPNCRLETIMDIIKGPDFPTGGRAYGKSGIYDAFSTGKGRIILRGKTEIVNQKNHKQIVITEIPYEVVKSSLVKRIDEIRFNKEIWGMSEVRDESDRNGLKIVVDLTPEADAQLVLNYLFKESNLQTSYNYNMVAIDNKTPKQLGILSILDAYIAHQKEVILRRCKFDYDKKSNRLHILDGLIKAISILDDLIATIRKSTNKSNAKENIIAKFNFSEKQAEAIVMLQLYRLSSTDILELKNEVEEIKVELERLNKIITEEEELKSVLIAELKEVKNKYGSPRKTEIYDEIEEIVIDKISTVIKEDVMFSVSRDGYAKRSQIKSYTTSNESLPGCKQTDAIVSYGQASTLDTLLIFTTGGNYLYVPVFELTETKWKDEGTHLNKIVSYPSNEKIISVVTVKEFRDDIYIVLASSGGSIKRTPLKEFVIQRYSKAISCFRMNNNEQLVMAAVSNGGCDIAVCYENGSIVRYDEKLVSIVGLKAGGVRSGSRALDDYKLAGGVCFTEEDKINFMIATDKGGIKPVYTRYINQTSRNTMGTLSFKSFKSDHHNAVALVTYNDKNQVQVVTNLKSYLINCSDIPYQAIDKIIKEYLKLANREKIETIIIPKYVYIDKNTKAVKVDNAQSFAKFDESQLIDEKKKEKYAKISIDDLFK